MVSWEQKCLLLLLAIYLKQEGKNFPQNKTKKLLRM